MVKKKRKNKLINLLKEEEQLLKHEQIETRHIYKKLLDIEELLKKKSLRKFNDVIEWRQNVWENCRYKKEKITQKEIIFVCRKTKKLCHFVDCPENLV
jgi:hypothetical protein